MGVRKQGSGKHRSDAKGAVSIARQPNASIEKKPPRGSGSAGGIDDDDEDSDPELQEVYVQAYACQIFSDTAAARAVEDGAHLRPLTISQNPGAEALMLDRFDARWMLDPADFRKETGSNMTASVMAEEKAADRVRYAGLPDGDHSRVVEGLGRFAPTGSYAHDRNAGGLGHDDDEDELEVLLRLKQASNPAFAFLSDEDPVHPYYLFLKTWGESALAAEYARQQQLKVERADVKKREAEREQERAEAAKATAKDRSSPSRTADESAESDDAPNLLGGAYDSSGDEENVRPPDDAHTTRGVSNVNGGAKAVSPPRNPATESETSPDTLKGDGQADEVPDVLSPPDEAKRLVVEKMVGFVARNGQAFEDRVRERERSNPAFDFLSASNHYHAYYKARLALARQQLPAATPGAEKRTPETTAAPSEVGNSSSPPAQNGDISGAQKATIAVQGSGGNDAAASPAAHAGRAVTPPVAPIATGGIGHPTGDTNSRKIEVNTDVGSDDYESAREGRNGANGQGGNPPPVNSASKANGAAVSSTTIAAQLRAKLNLDASPGTHDVEDRIRTHYPIDGQSIHGIADGGLETVGPGVPRGDGQKPTTASPLPGRDTVEGSAAADAVGDVEMTRANRLKRARLMTGHYKLAVMQHSTRHEGVTESGLQEGAVGSKGIPGPSASAGEGHGLEESSAEDLSDFDDLSENESIEGRRDALSNGDALSSNPPGVGHSAGTEEKQALETSGSGRSDRHETRRRSSSSRSGRRQSTGDGVGGTGSSREPRRREGSGKTGKSPPRGSRRGKDLDGRSSRRDDRSSARRRRSRSRSRESADRVSARERRSSAERISGRRSREGSKISQERPSRSPHRRKGDEHTDRRQTRSEKDGATSSSTRDDATRDRHRGETSKSRRTDGGERPREPRSGRRNSTSSGSSAKDGRHDHKVLHLKDRRRRSRSRSRDASRERGNSKRSRRR